MREMDAIHAVRRRLALGAGRPRDAFSTDAEIVDLDGRLLALTTDEFSAEDRLPADDPVALGWNLVVATLSDLLAVGAEPRCMLNALVTAPWMDLAWLEGLSRGMQDALDAHGATMLGGDVGSGPSWHFGGTGLGTFPPDASPRDRRTPLERGAVVATGAFGDGNVVAAGVHDRPLRLEVRLEASRALRDLDGAASIDTSDGLGPALQTLAGASGLHLRIDTAAVPRAPGVARAAQRTGLPDAAFLLGAAGEYEQLALVAEAAVPSLRSVGWTPLGTFERAETPGLSFRHADREVRLPALPDPRDAESEEAYRDRLVSIAHLVPTDVPDPRPDPTAGRKERS